MLLDLCTKTILRNLDTPTRSQQWSKLILKQVPSKTYRDELLQILVEYTLRNSTSGKKLLSVLQINAYCMFPLSRLSLCGFELQSEILIQIPKYCRELKILDLSFVQVPLEFVDEFVKYNMGSKLNYLSIRGFRNIPETEICKILQNSPNLENLDIGDCLISDDSVEIVVTKCKNNLKYLSLDNTFITEKSLHLLQQCKNIEFLNISYCHQIRGRYARLVELVQSLKLLSVFQMIACENIFENDGPREIRKIRPNLCFQFEEAEQKIEEKTDDRTRNRFSRMLKEIQQDNNEIQEIEMHNESDDEWFEITYEEFYGFQW